MAGFAATVAKWFGWGGALSEHAGPQLVGPIGAIGAVDLGDNARPPSPDVALQLSAIWSCIDRRASTVASLPLMVYERLSDGQKQLARDSRLWFLLHASPNTRMTPFDFWRVLVTNYDLRGNGYARIERDARGEPLAMWPMPADQVEPWLMPDGSLVYLYRVGHDVAVLDEGNVLHLRNLGNGTVGMDKIAFMNASTNEARRAQESASKMWANGGKPTGVLMIDHVLDSGKRKALLERFAEMAQGNTSRLYLLEADMKYQQIGFTPEHQQLLETRRFTIEEVCRWFDVPPILAHHSNVTTWGSAVAEILDGWLKLSLRPLLVSIEQAVNKRVLTASQRVKYTAEFNQDALVRALIGPRYDAYAKAVSNGWMTRNEVRQLENLAPYDNGDDLTAQVNLAPLHLLGQTGQTKPAATPAITG